MDLSNEGSGWAKTNTDLAVLPTNSTGYGTKECWQQRYAQEPDCCFGWFKTYMNLEPLPSKHIATKAAQILMLGCGNSTLSGDIMPLADGLIDLAIDKAILDALMRDEGDLWVPVAGLCENVGREVNEVEWVLAPGGKLTCISFGQPPLHRRHLECDSWDIEIESLNNSGFD
ncbi:hypothetical protein IW138_002156 [Coemansia sp. RSA 986]|nr:hypothetical protein IW138_002156 [Coemansia sp. RSA 986]